MLKNILKIEKILNHQQHLHFNVPYEDDDYYSDYRDARDRADKAEEKLKNLWDIPIQVELGEKFPFTGFVEIDGTIHKCKSCEHEDLVRSIVYDNPEYFKRYRNVPAVFYDHKPQGMLQEEYFLMKYLGFVKISSFEKTPTKKILFRYENLTWKQSDVIYPQ
jgi:hypothetical protein